jgi:hypothetical protein
LKDFTVAILPDGSPGRYFSSFGQSGIGTLKEWVSGGGTLITIRGSAVFAALKDVGLTTSKLVGSEDDTKKATEKQSEQPVEKPSEEKTDISAPKTTRKIEPAASPSPTPLPTDFDNFTPPVLPPIASPSADANKVPEALPGAFMRATVDRTNYLNYGVQQNQLPVMIASGYFFRYSQNGGNVLVFDEKPKAPLNISGFIWEGNTEPLLRGTSYLIDEPTGRGHVILFAEDPFFRGLTRGVTRQFFNAINFSGVF